MPRTKSLTAAKAGGGDPIREAWEDVILRGRSPRSPVRPEVLASWQRCLELNLDPAQPRPLPHLKGRELEKLLEAKAEMIEIAKPIIDLTSVSIRGTAFILTLADGDGYVLIVAGNDDVMAMARRNNYTVGCLRSEAFAGTNAIGLCLIEERPVQLTGAEHYNLHHHPWTCSSAPIRNSKGGIIGAITLSGPSLGRHQHTLALVTAAAEAVESQLREKELIKQKQELNSLLTSIFNSISEGVVALDQDLTITNLNSTAARMLGLDQEEVIGRRLDRSVTIDERLGQAIRRRTFQTNQETSLQGPGGVRTYIFSLAPIREGGEVNRGTLVTITEKRKVINMVGKIGGNHAKYELEDIKGRNERLLKQIDLAKIAATTSSRVLIHGETGTGKELFAQAIHNYSNRREGPFVAISCAAIPRDLIEAELFGYREGAFTGARRDGQVGKFELADGGTLFLDEINGLPLELQAKLLRALQQNEIIRLGDTSPIKVDVRVISASNTDLLEEVENNNFREDLYYRLNVVELVIPPLRERLDDLELLIDHMLDRHCLEMGSPKPVISGEVLERLHGYDWPGNIRELENCIERAVLLSRGERIIAAHLPERMVNQERQTLDRGLSVKEGMRTMIQTALEHNQGNVSQAAKELKIARSTIYRKMREYGLG